jgi:hypothetical protein
MNNRLRTIEAPAAGAGRGAGAVDRHRRGAGARDKDEFDPHVFVSLLRRQGLSEADIEQALALVQGGEATDRLPLNGLHGTGGHTSRGPSGSRADEADIEREYPGASNVFRDTYGDQPEPDLPRRHLVGGGIVARVGSRPVTAGDAALASDEDIERQIEREYGNAGPRVGMFGL